MLAEPTPNIPTSLAASESAAPTLNRRELLGGFACMMASPVAKVDDNPHDKGPLGNILHRARSSSNRAKELAIQDYRKSLADFQGRLSSAAENLWSSCSSSRGFDFDVIIIGSGYGGAICAARLSRALRPGARLGILERGKEWVPGTFPDSFTGEFSESMRQLFGKNQRSLENPLGLYNLLSSDDVSVFSANGLGGTSLLNANVSIRPNPQVFAQTAWPFALRDRLALEPYYDMAEQELGLQADPIDMTAKMRIHRLAAERLADCGATYEAAALAITRTANCGLPILNAHGMLQRNCTNCGDCTTGCNVGAKNTLPMNYLPLAKRLGAEMYTQTELSRLQADGDGYTLHVRQYCDQHGKLQCRQGTLRARIVILAAGSVGSTELLLRSQCEGMAFSSRLGQCWSANGDVLGIARHIDCRTSIGGVGSGVCNGANPGPTLQSTILFPHRPLAEQYCIQEGAAAKSLANLVALMARDIDLDHSHIMLVCGHDGNRGRVVVDSNGVRIVWPDLKTSPYRVKAEQMIGRLSERLGGEYSKSFLFRGKTITVHPLGGCNMADDATCGVVDDRGEVFASGYGEQTPNGRYEGLYVIDGSVIPTSLGVNPLATISAVSERAAALMIQDPRYLDLFDPTR